MNNIRKNLSVTVLVALLALTFVSSVHAFDGRDGDQVVVAANETVNDDLYVTAQEFTLDGTVNGDVLAVGQIVTINGTIEGDLMAAAQAVVVNGTVTGAIRIAGSTLQVGQNASIGGDILGAGYSLEVQQGSAVGQDIVFAGGQLLLAGDVARNVKVAANAFELRSTVGGNVEADVSDAGQAGPPPTMFMPQPPVPVPTVEQGLTIASSARIEGDLRYTQSRELSVPAGVVAGETTRSTPAVDPTAQRQETTGERITRWGLNLLRTAITFVLIGLVLLWLFPFFMQGSSGKLQSAPLPSLGWGVLAYAVFVILLLVTIIVTIAGGLLFGVLTLGRLSGTIVWLGILALFALVLGFVLVTSFVAKVVFGQALGKWLLGRTSPALAEHRYWPMIVGVVITAVVIALFSFPLIPGFLGGLLNFAVILFGLGALWLWSRDRTAIRPVG